MTEIKTINAPDEATLWQKVAADLQSDEGLLQYSVILDQAGRQVWLAIDIDLGGGFESGYETTSLVAPLHLPSDLKFAIHREHFTDEIGKFFGMQDIETGYPEFDKKLIVKTNNPDFVRSAFADASVRGVFEHLDNFTLGVTKHNVSPFEHSDHFLDLELEEGVTDPVKLRTICHAFLNVLLACESFA